MAAHIGADGEPHSEDAGDQMVLLLLSFRASIGDMIRYLDEASNGEFPDFQTTLAHQTTPAPPRSSRGGRRKARSWIGGREAIGEHFQKK